MKFMHEKNLLQNKKKDLYEFSEALDNYSYIIYTDLTLVINIITDQIKDYEDNSE